MAPLISVLSTKNTRTDNIAHLVWSLAHFDILVDPCWKTVNSVGFVATRLTSSALLAQLIKVSTQTSTALLDVA